MTTDSDLRRGRHVVSALHVHLVFVTKYRRGAITRRVRGVLQEAFASVCRDFACFLEACDGEDDHVHLLIAYPPTVAIAVLVNSLKGVSSRYVRAARLPEVRARSTASFWSPSYFAASCGGAPLDAVRQYVDSQRARPSDTPA